MCDEVGTPRGHLCCAGKIWREAAGKIWREAKCAVVLMVFQSQISGMIQQTRLVCEVPCRVSTLWPRTEAEVQVLGM